MIVVDYDFFYFSVKSSNTFSGLPFKPWLSAQVTSVTFGGARRSRGVTSDVFTPASTREWERTIQKCSQKQQLSSESGWGSTGFVGHLKKCRLLLGVYLLYYTPFFLLVKIRSQSNRTVTLLKPASRWSLLSSVTILSTLTL